MDSLQPVSWKPEFCVDGKWCGNAQRFATEQEAKDSAYDRFCRWFGPTGWRATPTQDPVNYKRENGVDTYATTTD